MKKSTKLKIIYWVLLCIASVILAIGFHSWDAKDFVLPVITMLCCVGAGYIYRMIDEENTKKQAAIDMAVKALQEEPVSEDLIEELKKIVNIRECVSQGVPVIKIASHFAEWQKEQFEKNRLKHCNSITNEQAELEQGFIDQHLNKYNRMPTFLDAIEYGMRLQKEKKLRISDVAELARDEMKATAVDAECFGFQGNNALFSIKLPQKDYLVGSKVKVIVIKED